MCASKWPHDFEPSDQIPLVVLRKACNLLDPKTGKKIPTRGKSSSQQDRGSKFHRYFPQALLVRLQPQDLGLKEEADEKSLEEEEEDEEEGEEEDEEEDEEDEEDEAKEDEAGLRGEEEKKTVKAPKTRHVDYEKQPLDPESPLSDEIVEDEDEDPGDEAASDLPDSEPKGNDEKELEVKSEKEEPQVDETDAMTTAQSKKHKTKKIYDSKKEVEEKEKVAAEERKDDPKKEADNKKKVAAEERKDDPKKEADKKKKVAAEEMKDDLKKEADKKKKVAAEERKDDPKKEADKKKKVATEEREDEPKKEAKMKQDEKNDSRKAAKEKEKKHDFKEAKEKEKKHDFKEAKEEVMDEREGEKKKAPEKPPEVKEPELLPNLDELDIQPYMWCHMYADDGHAQASNDQKQGDSEKETSAIAAILLDSDEEADKEEGKGHKKECRGTFQDTKPFMKDEQFADMATDEKAAMIMKDMYRSRAFDDTCNDDIVNAQRKMRQALKESEAEGGEDDDRMLREADEASEEKKTNKGRGKGRGRGRGRSRGGRKAEDAKETKEAAKVDESEEDQLSHDEKNPENEMQENELQEQVRKGQKALSKIQARQDKKREKAQKDLKQKGWKPVEKDAKKKENAGEGHEEFQEPQNDDVKTSDESKEKTMGKGLPQEKNMKDQGNKSKRSRGDPKNNDKEPEASPFKRSKSAVERIKASKQDLQEVAKELKERKREKEKTSPEKKRLDTAFEEVASEPEGKESSTTKAVKRKQDTAERNKKGDDQTGKRSRRIPKTSTEDAKEETNTSAKTEQTDDGIPAENALEEKAEEKPKEREKTEKKKASNEKRSEKRSQLMDSRHEPSKHETMPKVLSKYFQSKLLNLQHSCALANCRNQHCSS